jgi:hypothetical protein
VTATVTAAAARVPPPPAPAAPLAPRPSNPSLDFFALRTVVNARRYAEALRTFGPDEFGTGPQSPTRAHIDAVNALLNEARRRQDAEERRLVAAAAQIGRPGDGPRQALLLLKERNHALANESEKIWDFYFNLFSQRRGPMGSMLRGMDRIALDCYQATYLGLGKARSIPSPAPFTYLETGFGPATYRRGVRLSKLGARHNPFPLVKVPYHRLVNPWSLGAIPHEVAHNLQSDLGLWESMPARIAAVFDKAGLAKRNAQVWMRWHKETYADLAGTLLIGPAYVGALMDVVGRSRAQTAAYSDDAVHPTPIIRVPLNLHLLERMGFAKDAASFDAAWNALYPASAWARVPAWVRAKLPEQIAAVVEAICFTPTAEYGDRRLIDVIRFEPKHAQLTQEAAERIETGTSTGVLPERFLIGAARLALARRKVSPETIHRNFYSALERS